MPTTRVLRPLQSAQIQAWTNLKERMEVYKQGVKLKAENEDVEQDQDQEYDKGEEESEEDSHEMSNHDHNNRNSLEGEEGVADNAMSDDDGDDNDAVIIKRRNGQKARKRIIVDDEEGDETNQYDLDPAARYVDKENRPATTTIPSQTTSRAIKKVDLSHDLDQIDQLCSQVQQLAVNPKGDFLNKSFSGGIGMKSFLPDFQSKPKFTSSSMSLSRNDGYREENTNNLTKEMKIQFNHFLRLAKEFESQKSIIQAMEAYSSAYAIIPANEKLARKIHQLKQQYLIDASNLDVRARLKTISKIFSHHQDSGDYYVTVNSSSASSTNRNYVLPAAIYTKLYEYQRECIHWLCNLHANEMGGLLGDDMGLGKTVQISSFIGLLFHSSIARRILLILPVSLQPQWTAELTKWVPFVPVRHYEGSLKNRHTNYKLTMDRGGVLISSYGRAVSMAGGKESSNGSKERMQLSNPIREHPWDYVILDEGHRIKNPDIATTKAIKSLDAHYRIAITGTPVQNDLMELWSIFDFIAHGKLLGSRRTFQTEYANPITKGHERDASEQTKLLAKELNEALRKIIAPCFLRREKKDFPELFTQNKNTQTKVSGAFVDNSATTQSPIAVHKTDIIVWIYLTETQVLLYSSFLTSPAVRQLLNSTRSPLAALTVLKKICDHPRLVHQEMKLMKGMGWENTESVNDNEAESTSQSNHRRNILNEVKDISVAQLLAESNKLLLLLNILQSHAAEGHRTLIFSHSKLMLDLIARTIKEHNITYLRLDGDITSPEDRQLLIQRFNSSEDILCFLLTTGVGGVGLNLTSADRVVIFDPSWSPAVDEQAIDRCFRIGQQRPVVVYRFITCSTIEEVIYRKQVFKTGLMKTTNNNNNASEASKVMSIAQQNSFQKTYFTRAELREVFALKDHRKSQTHEQLEQLHPRGKRKLYPELAAHLEWLENDLKENVFGLSDNGLLYSQENYQSPEIDIPENDHDILHAAIQAERLVTTILETRQVSVKTPKRLRKLADDEMIPQSDGSHTREGVEESEAHAQWTEEIPNFTPRVRQFHTESTELNSVEQSYEAAAESVLLSVNEDCESIGAGPSSNENSRDVEFHKLPEFDEMESIPNLESMSNLLSDSPESDETEIENFSYSIPGTTAWQESLVKISSVTSESLRDETSDSELHFDHDYCVEELEQNAPEDLEDGIFSLILNGDARVLNITEVGGEKTIDSLSNENIIDISEITGASHNQLSRCEEHHVTASENGFCWNIDNCRCVISRNAEEKYQSLCKSGANLLLAGLNHSANMNNLITHLSDDNCLQFLRLATDALRIRSDDVYLRNAVFAIYKHITQKSEI